MQGVYLGSILGTNTFGTEGRKQERAAREVKLQSRQMAASAKLTLNSGAQLVPQSGPEVGQGGHALVLSHQPVSRRKPPQERV